MSNVNMQKEKDMAIGFLNQKKEMETVQSETMRQAYGCASAVMGENTLLKNILFKTAYAELEKFLQMDRTGASEADCSSQCARFCSVYQVIEDAGLIEEYEEWKASSNFGMQVTA